MGSSWLHWCWQVFFLQLLNLVGGLFWWAPVRYNVLNVFLALLVNGFWWAPVGYNAARLTDRFEPSVKMWVFEVRNIFKNIFNQKRLKSLIFKSKREIFFLSARISCNLATLTKIYFFVLKEKVNGKNLTEIINTQHENVK